MKASQTITPAQDTAATLFEMGLRDFPEESSIGAGSKMGSKMKKMKSKAWKLFMDTLRKPRGKKKSKH